MKTVSISIGFLSLPIAEKIKKARYIVTSMTGNANFTTPSPTLATITTNINALEAAAIAAMGGGVDDTANMHAKEYTLDMSLKLLVFYVYSIAVQNLITADAVALSAGMELRKQAVHTAREFTVSVTENAGEVKLSTKAVKRATYMWEMCTDPSNEENWEIAGQGTRAKLLVTGLTSATRYYFRVSVINKDGQGPWSNVLNTVVL